MPIRAVEWSGAEAVGTGSPAAGSSAGPGREQVGDRTATQAMHSLRLLPSGPDRVGEGPARRRPPTILYRLPTPTRQAGSFRNSWCNIIQAVSQKLDTGGIAVPACRRQN